MSPNLKTFAIGHWGWRSRLDCLRCKTTFHGRDAFKRHLVAYPGEAGFWCHLSEEVGLIPGIGDSGWRLPSGELGLDPGISAAAGHCRYESRAVARVGPAGATGLASNG